MKHGRKKGHFTEKLPTQTNVASERPPCSGSVPLFNTQGGPMEGIQTTEIGPRSLLHTSKTNLGEVWAWDGTGQQQRLQKLHDKQLKWKQFYLCIKICARSEVQFMNPFFMITLLSSSSHAGEISCAAMQKFRYEADGRRENVTPNSAPGLTREGAEVKTRPDLSPSKCVKEIIVCNKHLTYLCSANI